MGCCTSSASSYDDGDAPYRKPGNQSQPPQQTQQQQQRPPGAQISSAGPLNYPKIPKEPYKPTTLAPNQRRKTKKPKKSSSSSPSAARTADGASVLTSNSERSSVADDYDDEAEEREEVMRSGSDRDRDYLDASSEDIGDHGEAGRASAEEVKRRRRSKSKKSVESSSSKSTKSAVSSQGSTKEKKKVQIQAPVKEETRGLLRKEESDEEEDDDGNEADLPEVVPTKTLPQFFKETTWTKDQVAEVKSLFNFCDLDGNGSINKAELKSMFVRMNINATEKQFNDLFSHLDGNHDGQVSFKEFLDGIRWLQKGAVLDWNIMKAPESDEEEDPEILDLQRKLDVYTQYASMVIQNGVEALEKRLRKGDQETALHLMEVLDPVAAQGIDDLLTKSGKKGILTKSNVDKLQRAQKVFKSSTYN